MMRACTNGWRMGQENHTAMAGPEEEGCHVLPLGPGLSSSWHWVLVSYSSEDTERGEGKGSWAQPHGVSQGDCSSSGLFLFGAGNHLVADGEPASSQIWPSINSCKAWYMHRRCIYQKLPQLYLRHQLGIVLLFCHTAGSMFPSCCPSWPKSDTHQTNTKCEAQNNGTTHYPGGQKTSLDSPFWPKTGIRLLSWALHKPFSSPLLSMYVHWTCYSDLALTFHLQRPMDKGKCSVNLEVLVSLGRSQDHTESQNYWGWKRPPEIIEPNPHAKAGSL